MTYILPCLLKAESYERKSLSWVVAVETCVSRFVRNPVIAPDESTNAVPGGGEGDIPDVTERLDPAWGL